MALWCFQCGELGTPERAVGVDVDGEPACAIHRVKPQLTHSAVEAISREVYKVEPAAPSPLQATEQEKAEMADTLCTGFGSRLGTCTEKLGAHNTSGLCKKCYANKNYADKHPGKPKRTTPRKAPASLTELRGAEVATGPVNPCVDLGVPPESAITITLPAWKLSRLIAALL